MNNDPGSKAPAMNEGQPNSTPLVNPEAEYLSRQDAWVEMKLRMIQRRCQEAVDVLNDLTPQHHDAAYKMGYASHALGGIIEDIDFTLSMRGQVLLFSPACACGHHLEDHEKVRVTDGSGFDTFRRCAVPGCKCADEELLPLTQRPLCLTCRTPMSPVEGRPRTFECLFCKQGVPV